ncbi:MAG: lysophospholipid acyltransferase family protein [Myxococcaceae bacterium]
MFYAFVRAVVSFAIRLFYRVQVNRRPLPDGPVIFVGNHPNSLVDPALVFVITSRPVTFLAKEPLFRMPLIGWLLRGLRVLPVYRKQDHPNGMAQNEGTFEAANRALADGGAITLFPEGKSHSEPGLAELKTGAARIALRAAKQGVAPKIVPVGLTYEEKSRFRSGVLIEIGEAIDSADFVAGEEVQRLTEATERGLRSVTLNLEHWEDLPVVEAAEELYAFRVGEKAREPDRLRRFATGIQLFREEQPDRFASLRDEVMSFRSRLGLVHASTDDLTNLYRRSVVYRFILRNMAALFIGFPLFLIGVVLFALPFWFPRFINRAFRVEWDVQATVMLLSALTVSPLWAALLTLLAWHFVGPAFGVVAAVGCLPLALWTRYFYERRKSALRDVRVFFTLGNRARLKARLLVEGDRLAGEMEKLADEYWERVDPSVPPKRTAARS